MLHFGHSAISSPSLLDQKSGPGFLSTKYEELDDIIENAINRPGTFLSKFPWGRCGNKLWGLDSHCLRGGGQL